MTWNTLAVLSASGGNLWQRFLGIPYSYDQAQKRLSFHTIAASLPLLDHVSGKDGQIYSFPKEISGRCNNGKRYHFWYSAFLARRATLENGDPRAASATAFQAEKFYQIRKSNAMGGGNLNAMNQGNLFSPASNIVRVDLAYAAVGAIYGAQKATDQPPSPNNVDSVISSLLSKAGRGAPGSIVTKGAAWAGSPYENYPPWLTRYNPNPVVTNLIGNTNFSGRVDKSASDFEKFPQTISCPKKQIDPCNDEDPPAAAVPDSGRP